MRSLVNRMSDRLVGMVVPKISASACTTYNCGCNTQLHLKSAKECCFGVCTPCIWTSAC
jgi:hypothetical protein